MSEKPLACLLEDIHKFKETVPDDDDIPVWLPANIIDELLSLTLSSLHMRCRIDQPVHNTIGATDACDASGEGGPVSGGGLGGCEATVSHALAEHIFRRADHRGERVKLGNVLVADKHFKKKKQNSRPPVSKATFAEISSKAWMRLSRRRASRTAVWLEMCDCMYESNSNT